MKVGSKRKYGDTLNFTKSDINMLTQKKKITKNYLRNFNLEGKQEEKDQEKPSQLLNELPNVQI